MPIIVKMAQDVGARSNQQDSCDWSAGAQPQCGVMAVLSDGIGGRPNGDKYSNLAVKTMLESFKQSDSRQDMCEVLLKAYGDARRKALDGYSDGGGATVAAVLVRGEKAAFLSVGDSRICLLRRGALIQLNRTQTLAVQLDLAAALGYLTEDEARLNRMRGALTNHLCEETDKPCDRCTEPFALCAGDKLALFSDGVFDALNENEIIASLRKPGASGAEEIIRRIREKHKPKQDNCSAVVIAVVKSAEDAGIMRRD